MARVLTSLFAVILTNQQSFGPIDADIALTHVATRQLAGGAVPSEYLVKTAVASPDSA
jgi:hypothetical protein